MGAVVATSEALHGDEPLVYDFRLSITADSVSEAGENVGVLEHVESLDGAQLRLLAVAENADDGVMELHPQVSLFVGTPTGSSAR